MFGDLRLSDKILLYVFYYIYGASTEMVQAALSENS